MFKRISAALLAVSVLAAPAFAATSGKTTQAPVTKQAPVKTNANTGLNALNANAKMDGHQISHHRHHRYHKISARKIHTKVSYRHVKPVTKRG
jgi:uncharacterized protein YdbL (DUF1318 family)